MGALNLGDQMCDPNPSVFREKLGVEGSLIIVSHWAGSRVYGTSESVFSSCFDVVIFSFV